MSDPRHAIGINVQHKRIMLGISLDELSQQSAIPIDELEKMENNDGDFPVEYLFRLAPILHFRVSDMVMLEEQRRARLGALIRLFENNSQDELATSAMATPKKLSTE